MIVGLKFRFQAFPVFTHRSQIDILRFQRTAFRKIGEYKIASFFSTSFRQPLVARESSFRRCVGIDSDAIDLGRVGQDVSDAVYLESIVQIVLINVDAVLVIVERVVVSLFAMFGHDLRYAREY